MIETAITIVVIISILIAEHYFPWQVLLGRKLPRLAAYVIGVLAMVVPLSVLYGYWAMKPPGLSWIHLAALWSVVISGGLTVIGSYALDAVMLKMRLADDLKEILELRDAEESGTDWE